MKGLFLPGRHNHVEHTCFKSSERQTGVWALNPSFFWHTDSPDRITSFMFRVWNCQDQAGIQYVPNKGSTRVSVSTQHSKTEEIRTKPAQTNLRAPKDTAVRAAQLSGRAPCWHTLRSRPSSSGLCAQVCAAAAVRAPRTRWPGQVGARQVGAPGETRTLSGASGSWSAVRVCPRGILTGSECNSKVIRPWVCFTGRGQRRGEEEAHHPLPRLVRALSHIGARTVPHEDKTSEHLLKYDAIFWQSDRQSQTWSPTGTWCLKSTKTFSIFPFTLIFLYLDFLRVTTAALVRGSSWKSDRTVVGSIPTLPSHVLKCPWATNNPILPLLVGWRQLGSGESTLHVYIVTFF